MHIIMCCRKCVSLNKKITASSSIFWLSHLLQCLSCLIYQYISPKSSRFHIVYRSNHPEVFLRKGVLKICSTFTGKHPCWSAISIKLLCNFIEITLRHGCPPVNLLYIFKTTFPQNASEGLLLKSKAVSAIDSFLCYIVWCVTCVT